MKPEILIVAALEQESNGLFETLGHEVLYTGVGKLNAAIRLMKRLSKPQIPFVVLNLGTAGGGFFPRKIVHVRKFVERDFDFMDISKPIHTALPPEVDGLNCGTGDSFMTREQLQKPNNFSIADMEGYALAKVCGAHSVPFLSLKYISDDGSIPNWQKSLEISAHALTEHAKFLIQEIQRLYP